MGAFAVVATVALLLGQAASPPAPPKPLPGNKACAFPALAREQRVSGPVRFSARVAPDGSVEGVEIRRTPWPDVGFEDGVRACVLQWRFEPQPAATAPRTYEGQMRFRLAPADEDAIRATLVSLAEAWNAEDKKKVDTLEIRAHQVPPNYVRWLDDRPFLRKAVQGDARSDDFTLDPNPDVVHVFFGSNDLASVRQVVYRRPSKGASDGGGPATLDLALARGSEGWRFIRADRVAAFGAARVGEQVTEPKLLKHVPPEYPDIARQARVEGLVILECVISTEGRVTDLVILRGLPLLDGAAIDAVRQWVYEPTVLNGQVVPVILQVSVNFNLAK